MQFTTGDFTQRFWAKVDVSSPDGCWLWTGARASGKYGAIKFQGRQYSAHRVSWSIHNGPVPDGLFVCHRCDNPVCVNPSHLFVDTPKGNIMDMVSKGRHANSKKTNCGSCGSEYSEENTYYRKDGSRSCKQCYQAQNRKYHWRNREKITEHKRALYHRKKALAAESQLNLIEGEQCPH